jgi:zinc protease
MAALARGLAPVRTVLDNGAAVTVQQTSLAPAVTISAAFPAGAVHDPPDRPGVAYLAARVIDRGTERRSAGVIAEELDERGVSLKVSTNRQTLTLSCTCLAEDFGDVLAILADVARRPVFPESEVDKRRGELLTAIRQDLDNPAIRAMEGLFELVYGADHPYGRPLKGTLETIEQIGRADLAAFHAAHIRPSGLSLVIVGDVPAAEARARAECALADWHAPPAPTVAIPAPLAIPPRRMRRIEMPGKPQTDVAYGFAAVRRADPRYYAYWMMNNVLGQFGLGGRLAENIRERQGMAYYAFSTLDPAPAEAPLLVRAGVDPGNVDRVIAAIDHEVAALGTAGPTRQEVEETREYLIGSIPRMLETNESIASFLQNVEEFGLGLDFDRRLPGLLRAVTLEEVAAAAAALLDPAHAAVVVAGPAPAAGSADRAVSTRRESGVPTVVLDRPGE